LPDRGISENILIRIPVEVFELFSSRAVEKVSLCCTSCAPPARSLHARPHRCCHHRARTAAAAAAVPLRVHVPPPPPSPCCTCCLCTLTLALIVFNTLCSTPCAQHQVPSPPEQITASTTHERTTVACLARVYGGVAVAAGQATHCVSLSSCGLRRWQGSPLQVEIAVDNLKLYTYTLVDHRGWTSRYRTCILLALPMAVDAAARRRCLLR